MRGFRFKIRQGDDRGAQVVEFALIWTFVLAPVLYGLIAFGFIMNQQITASQVAREAARTGAVCVNTSGASSGTCNAKGQSVTKPAGFGAATVTVDTTACFPTAAGHDVTATVSISPALPVPVLSQINGKATTPCGG